MRSKLVVLILSLLFIAVSTCTAQKEFRAGIVADQANDLPPGRYFNIDKGNSDGLFEGDLLTVQRAFGGRILEIAKVHVVAVTPTWARVGRFSEDLGKRILNTDFVVRDRQRETISFVAQIGHSRPVNVVAVSPNEQFIASAALDGSVKVWDRSSRHLLYSVQAFDPSFVRFERMSITGSNSVPNETITALAFSPNSKFLAIGTSMYENNLKLWDITKGKVICTFVDDEGASEQALRMRFPRPAKNDSGEIESEGPIKSIQFSPDGKLLAAGSSQEYAVKIWDIGSKKLRKKLQMASVDKGFINGSFSFSNDGLSLATLYARYPKEFLDGKMAIKSWGIGSWQDEGDFSGDIEMNSEIVSSPGYLNLVILAPSGTVAVADWQKKVVLVKNGDLNSLLQFSTLGGNGLVARSSDGKIRVTSLDSKSAPKEFIVDARPPIRLSRSNRLDGSNGGDWDPNPKEGPDTFIVGPKKLVPVCFASSGKWLVWGRYDGTITIWNANGKSNPVQLSPAAVSIESFAVATNTAFEEDQLATADSTGEIYLWSLRSGSLVKTFVGLQKGAQALSFSADGTKLIGSAQFEAITWDIASGKSLAWKIEDENADRRFVVASAMNSAKGVLALGRNDGYVDIWDVKTHAFLGRVGDLDPGAVGADIGPGFISKVVFSNSGDLVAFQKQGGALDVWDYKLHIRKLQNRCGGSALTFSSDDHLLACAIASQGTIWDLDSGKVEKELKTEEQRLSSIEFSNDGTEIFGGAFNAIVVWDVKSGEIKRVLRDNSSPMGLKAIGTTSLVSINEDSTIGIFGTQHAVLLAKGVTLSQDSWLSFTPDGFFDGTSQAWKELAFHSDLNPLTLFDLERFFSQFYQPGLLSSAIEDGRPVRDVLASRNDPRALIEIGPLKTSHLPIVRFASPSSAQLEITGRQIPITLEAEDTGSGVQDCRVFRNGILVFRDRRALTNEGAHLSLSFDLTVVAGKNAVKAYCFNRDQLKSKDFTFLLTGSKSLYRKGKAYIFSIGIDDYGSSPLHYAKADAGAIAGKLSSTLSTTARYDVQTPIVLRDSSATKNNITWALRAFAGDPGQGEAPLPELRSATLLQPEDSLIIYFAGHGFAKGQHYYLVPYDFLQPISEEDLQSALEPIDVSHLGLIIDSCQSGSLLSPEVRTGPLNSGGLAQLAYEKGAYILAASQSDQPAREFDSLKHGLLTSVLINNAFSTLSEGLPQNSYIYMGDWLSAAVREVPVVHSHLYESNATRSEKVSFGQPQEAGRSPHYWYQVPGLYFRREGEELAFPIARTPQ